MFRALLYQTLLQRPVSFNCIRNHYRSEFGTKKYIYWDGHLVVHFLEIVLKSLTWYNKVLFILDGLDEFFTTNSSFVSDEIRNSFHVLHKLQEEIKIIVLSRDIAFITQQLVRYPRIVLQEENYSDIKKAVELRMNLLIETLGSIDEVDISPSADIYQARSQRFRESLSNEIRVFLL